MFLLVYPLIGYNQLRAYPPPTLKVSHRSLKAPPSLSKSLKVSQFDLGFVGVTFLFVFGALFGGKNSEPF